MKNSKKYTCKLTKEEIVNAIIEQFETVNKEYSESLQDDSNDDSRLQERKFGRYIAMIELLNKVQIFEN